MRCSLAITASSIVAGIALLSLTAASPVFADADTVEAKCESGLGSVFLPYPWKAQRKGPRPSVLLVKFVERLPHMADYTDLEAIPPERRRFNDGRVGRARVLWV